MDGDTPIRRFLPGGAKSFAFDTSIAKERQKHLWVHGLGRPGRRGHRPRHQLQLLAPPRDPVRRPQQPAARQPPEAPRRQRLLRGLQRRDRHLRQRAVERPASARSAASSSTRSSGSAASPSTARPRTIRNAASTPAWSMTGRSLSPSAGCEPARGRQGGRAARHAPPCRRLPPRRWWAARVLDGVFPLDAKPVIHVWQAVYPVSPSKFLKTTARTTLPPGQARRDQRLPLGAGLRTPPGHPHQGQTAILHPARLHRERRGEGTAGRLREGRSRPRGQSRRCRSRPTRSTTATMWLS